MLRMLLLFRRLCNNVIPLPLRSAMDGDLTRVVVVLSSSSSSSRFCLRLFLTVGTVWGGVCAGSFGALVHGPTGHYFYGALDAKLPGTKPMTVAAKVAIDQVRYSNNAICTVSPPIAFTVQPNS